MHQISRNKALGSDKRASPGNCGYMERFRLCNAKFRLGGPVQFAYKRKMKIVINYHLGCANKHLGIQVTVACDNGERKKILTPTKPR